MSDGGRGRALLGLEGWKSSQNWCAQRSAVRSIGNNIFDAPTASDQNESCDRAARNGVIPLFPHRFGRGEDVPADLIGATIVQIGTTDEEVESGEFVIEYRPAGESRRFNRLALLFNERGMWIRGSDSVVRSKETSKQGGD